MQQLRFKTNSDIFVFFYVFIFVSAFWTINSPHLRMAGPFCTATAHALVAVWYLQMKKAQESFFPFLFVLSVIFESLWRL